ncbi:biopolymer transporter ExbD [bacterium]|nr:biopolymer transporter ExbD [bacterium]
MRDTFNEINITPLTDIFLVLLIIMMVIAPLLDQQGLNLTVPEMVAQEQVKDNDFKILTVIVSADDKYYVDGSEVLADDLENTLKKMAKDFPDGMMIESDGNSSHGAVVKLMDNARNSGITSISVTEI